MKDRWRRIGGRGSTGRGRGARAKCGEVCKIHGPRSCWGAPRRHARSVLALSVRLLCWRAAARNLR
eukprot:1111530-Pyramimonas_sp.AAC.1